MLEQGDHLQLTAEAGQRFEIAHQLNRQDLDRHLTVKTGIVSPVDSPHLSVAQLLLDLVSPDLIRLHGLSISK